MRSLWMDAANGVRAQLRTPAVTLVAALTLAFGVAANTVAFSLVNALFLRPLPVQKPEQLVRVYGRQAGGFQHFTVDHEDFVQMSQLTSVFSGVLAEGPLPLSVRAGGASERVWGYLASSAYFSLLGVRPVEGRLFGPEEEGKGGPPVAVLGYGLWQRRFGGARGAVGETVIVNGRPVTVIGVAPESFRGTNLGLAGELWLPAAMEAQLVPGGSGGRGYFVMGRLRAGVPLGQARAALDLLAQQLQDSYPDRKRSVRFTVLPEAQGRVHPMVRGSLMGFSAVLVAVAALLLLLACVNVAGLLLARTAVRRKEIGMRMVLGATRGRVIRQFLTETTTLALAASGLGLALTWLVTKLLSAVRVPIDAPLSFDFGQDGRVLGFTLLVAVATAVLVGLAPALDASRSDLVGLLKDGGPGAGLRRSRLRSAIVALQIAISTPLLIGGGLFLRSLEKAQEIDLGFDPDGVVMTSLDLGLDGYSAEEARGFWRRLLDRLAATPRVESVSLVSAPPFELNITTMAVAPDGDRPPPDGRWPFIQFAVVGAEYFGTMRIPLVEGREYEERDTDSFAKVVIVNDVLARQFWPGTTAVGKRLVTPEGRLEVVGVARHTKYLALGEEPKPFLYFPHCRCDVRAMTVIARGAGDPAALLEDMRAGVRAVDDRIPLYNLTTMSERVALALAPAKWGAAVLNAISLMALALASVGLYGTLAYTVGRRTREIGVRRALGARNGDVIRLVVGHTLMLVAIGLASGTALGLVGARLLTRLLYDVDAADPASFGLAPLVLLLAGLAAAWMPARRATRIDPAQALRYE